MEQYVTRIGDVTIQRVIPTGGGPPEPVRVMESEELLRAVKEEPIDEDEEQEEPEEENDEAQGEDSPMEEEDKVKGEHIVIKQEPQDRDDEEEEEENENQDEEEQNDDEMEKDERREEEPGDDDKDNKDDLDDEKGESTKRKVDSEGEDSESSAKKKKVEIDVDNDKKKISNLRRNIREVMDETQLDEATLAAQRQEAERLRRVQDQQKYIREVQRQIQLNRQNSKTQSRVISLLQGGSTSILKSTSTSGSTTSTSTGPSTVLVKLGSGQQQALNRKTLEVLRGGKSVSSTSELVRPGITRVTPGNKPAMVTPSVSIAPVKPVSADGQKKVSNDADVVTISSSSDSEDDCIVISEGEGEEEEEEEDLDPTNSGMHTNDLYNIPDEQGRVLINVGKPENEPEVFLAPQIARIIKPHQIGGVRFLFDNVVESIERFNNSTGFGCILAHSMGLGKTLQVVSFCDVFLRETTARTVMCIMPINTLQNWVAEFNMWLPTDPTTSPLAVHGEVRPRNFGIFVLNDLHKTISSRSKVVEEWNREGGVLLIGYEMYRQLSLKRPGRVRKGKKKAQEEDVEDEKNKPLLEAMHEALVRPGPDLVICDEGHRIKNSHASISHALKQIRTKRRVVLTGYPLQNNLLEYWCMVDFVRPNYLGTKTEFSNMFERPIQNGQCIDSTPQDIRLMRYRAHVLHSLLEGFVQRRSHSVLRNSLPQKEEYVLLVRMTPFQRTLYDTFMNEVVRTKAVPNPLKAFAVCCKIWNHPDILYNFLKKKEMDELQDLDLEEAAALHQPAGPNSPRRPLAKDKKGKKEVKKLQVAPIKPEVSPGTQSQTQTPELKQEERKTEFGGQAGGGQGQPPGYDYYPHPPGYTELGYQYRVGGPGMYYQGYYQDSPPYYHGYDQPFPPPGHPGYYQGFDPSYPGGPPPSKGDQVSNPWPTSYPNIKQEKNPSKSPKDFEAQAPPKPGFQEFYPLKEEKPDVKEEKQTFLCGFSGGQVSYNYRNCPGYPNYPPFPPQEYPGWNKDGFPAYPQGEQGIPGGPPPMGGGPEHMPASHGNQQGMFGPNQQDSRGRANTNQPHSMPGQGNQHGGLERSQNAQGDNHPAPMGSDSQQRSHGNQNVHEHTQSGHMSLQSNQKDDQQRMPNQDHLPPQSPMFPGQRNEGNPENIHRSQDSSMKSRNLPTNDPKNMHNSGSNQNVMQPSNQGLFNPHDSGFRNQQHLYGNRNPQDEFRPPCSGPDQSSYGNQRVDHSQGLQSNKDNQQPNVQSLSDNQHRMHVNPEHNPMHSQNIFGSPRSDHGPRGNIDHHMASNQNPSFQSNQERMASSHQNMYSNMENQHSFHDNTNRLLNSQDHFSSNQQGMFGNKRMEQNLASNQQVHESQRRPSIGQENTHAAQQGMFGNQRNDHGQEHSQMSHQNMGLSHEKQDTHHRMHGSQERHGNSQQMFASARNELKSHDHFTSGHNKHENELSNQSTKHSNQQSLFANHRAGDAGKHGQPEHMQTNQQNMNTLQESPQRMQNTHERLGSSHNIYQDHMQEQNMFKGPGPPENQHGASSAQHNFFTNQLLDHAMHSGQDHAHNSQSNINNQNVQQNQKRMSDHAQGMQQGMYQNQSEHSIQKMIKGDSHVENQQAMHSNQERPHQYNVFSASENPYNTQESHQRGRQNVSENKESKHGSHMSRERLLGGQGLHNLQEQKQMSQQGMFSNPNIPETQWMQSNQERGGGQQNMFDPSHHGREEARVNQDKQQQYQNNQDYLSHGQQNMFSSQNSQHNLHRSSDQMHGKQQNLGGNQSMHESQYRMTGGQPASEGQPGNLNSQEQMQGNPQSMMSRQNSHEHTVHHQDHSQSNQSPANSQSMHGNTQMQRSMHHKGQEQIPGQHGMMGSILGGKHGPHITELPHPSQHGVANPQGHHAAHLNPQMGGHYNQDGTQSINNMQGYGIQNSPQQKISSHDSSQNTQHSMQQSSPHSNQSMNRNQHGAPKNQDAMQTNQQAISGHPHSGSQHNIYSNQYHMQSDQHALSNQQHHGSQHSVKNLPMLGQQSNHNISAQTFGTQMQGNNQSGSSSQGLPQHMQSFNTGQGMHGSPQVGNTAQGMHAPPSMNQGMHGNQHPANQPLPGNQPFSPNQNSQVPSSPYSGSHAQYLTSPNQQTNPNSSHNIHADHLQSQQNSNSKMSHGAMSQHSMSSPAHNKNQATSSKQDSQKLQASSIQNPSPHSQNVASSQHASTPSGVDHPGNQHRIQNMLGYPHSQHSQQFDQNVIMNKSMSGGQVLQGAQQTKHSMQNVLSKGDDPNMFKSGFAEQFPSNNDNFPGNCQKPAFYGHEFQFPYQNQFQFQDSQFSEQAGPSGQAFRKEDERKDDENKQKDGEKKNPREGEEAVKTATTSTSTETEAEQEKRDKKDEEDKPENKKEKTDTTPTKSGKEDPGIPYDWATELLKGYVPGDISASGKMAVFFCIIEESIALGDRILVFSQSLFTLNLMEELLQQQLVPGKEVEKWAKNINYYRLDGSTTAMEREKLINEFNSNPNLHLFLVSTRAGSLGINLVGANRVIVFDASWNPCHDTQAVCRVYRYGQKKPCFVYRLVTDNCLEKKIYDRQINKQGMSDRVVDECNPDAHLSIKEVTSLCWDDKEDESPKDFSNLQDSYIDVVLQKVIQKHSSELSKEPFAHESLLVDRKEKKLSQAEKRLAKRSYELEKQASTRPVYNGVNQNQNRMKPMASVRPMQAEMGGGQRPRGWIPASVWQRQGMSAQEMTLPLDVVIPTNSADRASIVLKAGQKVMVLKSPKGIYMQLENGKIIAIRTAFKMNNKKPGEQTKGAGIGGGEIARRGGIRQLGATRGRPVRAVGPVTRPPPLTVSITKKKPSEDDQSARQEEESESVASNAPSTPTPMEVSVMGGEKEVPNPFTAAAAASLSGKQALPIDDTGEEGSSDEQVTEKQAGQTQASPQPKTPQGQGSVSPQHLAAHVAQQQVPVQPLASPVSVQVQAQPPQPSPAPAQAHGHPVPPQQPVQPQAAIQPQPQAAVPPQPQAAVPPQPQAAVPPQPQAAVPPQPQAAVPPQPQHHPAMHLPPQPQPAQQPLPPAPQPPPMPQQIPLQAQYPPTQGQFSLPQPSLFPSHSQGQKQSQGHFPPMTQQQYSLAPQFPMHPQAQAQYLPPHPQQAFPMQYPLPQAPHLPPQPYPVQPQAQYPMQPHLQQPQYSHQFPLHPQAQFPLHPPPQYEPPPPIPPSMLTDQLS